MVNFGESERACVRKQYRASLTRVFHAYLIHTRQSLGLTQQEMAQKLEMDERSYVELDHGKSCCSAVTLLLFLIHCCKDPLRFLEDIRSSFQKASDDAA